MIGVEHQQLEDVERRVCDIAAVQLGIARGASPRANGSSRT